MPDYRLRAMQESDQNEVAELICASMNVWDILHGMAPGRFTGPDQTAVFNEVYETLDPGHCVVAESPDTGRLMGSCYYRARETHVSLGIMNVHPNHYGKGLAKAMLEHIIAFQEEQGVPLRLVSSLMNLESFALYTKAGFVPRLAYQDFLLAVPEEGLGVTVDGLDRVRDATLDDVEPMAELELEVAGISRRKDYRYFIENEYGHWHTAVYEDAHGRLQGYLGAIGHPLFLELGPGVARDEKSAAALLVSELDRHRGRVVYFLVPVESAELVRLMYGLGARLIETHAAQVRGEYQPFRGVSFPTFMPETG
ncbi:MAG: GNAT family N-acetyltransferase [Thermoleophilia bacterium]|nr:GNAT family N-acetyltransferase [Thermoleophilia bacterium]